MKRFLSFLFICLFSTVLNAQPVLEPKVRAYVEPDQTLYAGQVFTLYLEVKVPTWLLSSPEFPVISFDDAFAIQPEQLAENFVEKVRLSDLSGTGSGTHTFSGLRQRFLVVSHKEGVLDIPAYHISFSYSGEDRKETNMTMSTEPLSVSIALPPGLQKDSSNLTIPVAKGLTLTQTFVPDVNNLVNEAPSDVKVGDAITRIITIEADQSLGFMLPKIDFTHVKGAEVYPAQARIEDELARGQVFGRRIESASYVMQENGSFEFPEIAIAWFNLETGEIETAVIESQSMMVAESTVFDAVDGRADLAFAAAVLSGSKAVLGWMKAHQSAIVWSLLSLILFVGLYRRYGKSMVQVIRDGSQQVKNSDAFQSIRVTASVMIKAPSEYQISLYRWASQPQFERFKSSQSWLLMQQQFKEGGMKVSRFKIVTDVIKTYLDGRKVGLEKGLDELNP